MDKMMFLIILLVATVATSDAFWWGSSSEREVEPSPAIKQVPVGFFRTYTYQPLSFNPAAASSYFGYGTAKMINPMQYWPPKPYTQIPASSLSSYNGPLQALGSTNQQTREPSPVVSQTSGSPSSASSASMPSSSLSATGANIPVPQSPGSVSSVSFTNTPSVTPPPPVVSIAESLTSDDHLPASPSPNPPPQSQQYSASHTQQTPYSSNQFSSAQPQTQYPTNQFSAPLAPIPAQQYHPSVPASGRPFVNPYIPTDINQVNLPYLMTGTPVPVQSVQFVPCMCPVSYGMASNDLLANKRSDETTLTGEIHAQLTVPTTVETQISLEDAL